MSICPIGADTSAKARSEMAGKLNKEEVETMDKKVRLYLESRGLPKDATEEEAYRFLEKLDVRKEEPAPSTVPATQTAKGEEELRTEATRAEQTRILEIRGICGKTGADEKEIEGFITGHKSVEEVRKAMFDRLVDKPSETPDTGLPSRWERTRRTSSEAQPGTPL